MSECMKIMPFKNLMEWAIDENNSRKSIFGVKKYYKADTKKGFNIYREHIETPIGPAAGPNSQLAQNIVSSYVAGARFFELKTVQEITGIDMVKCINKPCIKADDECYNCEWSTELYMDEAIQEYIKAWVMLHFISKEYGLGASDGFVFNMSVGYKLQDIKKKDTDMFIECMKDASKHKVFDECKEYLRTHISEYKNFTLMDIDAIPSRVCDSVTMSTLHGCPSDEIERIAMYLMEEKGLNTFIKCNPTLVGFDKTRKILDEMGYTYVSFTDSHFLNDLLWDDAVKMIKRLLKYADSKELTFGVKLTNTFPVDVRRNELPSNEMYLSGKPLFALSIKVAEMFAEEFEGKLKMSYSGGADYFNIDKLVDAGIWPVTVATTILKPGGYDRFYQMAEKIMANVQGIVSFDFVDTEKVKSLSNECLHDKHLMKKALRQNKLKIKNPLTDCFVAPCSNTCPINQDISLYNYYVKNNEFEKALEVIYKTNPLPFITGNICVHPCITSCMRNHYEENIDIRGNKLLASRKGFDKIIKNIKKTPSNGKKVAVIGAGPGGIAVSSFLSREGYEVTSFDKEKIAGGAVANIMSRSRISMEDIEKDILYAKTLGVKFELGTEIKSVKELKDKFDYVIISIGARKKNTDDSSSASIIKLDSEFYTNNGIEINDKGLPVLDKNLETSIKGVYAIGEGAFGASVVVKVIANAKIVASAICNKDFESNIIPNESIDNIYNERAALKDTIEETHSSSNDASRCLHCNVVCETCNEVCPNRANVHIILKDGSHQIVHIDSMCNECGNCETFCPYDSKPYKDKFTLFFDENAMNDSTNSGFYFKNDSEVIVRINGDKITYKLGTSDERLGKLAEVIDTISEKHKYMVF
ncbi:MAG: FAD-dependent oxidoreductase [Lachnospiraceae bacterium]|nr:FAD-dependent oxidoreductase [Lachnospiraceae bacterium]